MAKTHKVTFRRRGVTIDCAEDKTKATCSSEPVLSARSTAVRAAKIASLEPSVARRIFVGKMLI
jgi:hypothetical protein